MAGTAGDAGAKRLSIDDIKPPVRDVTVVTWPGTGREVGLLHLNVGELMDAHVEARAYCAKRAVPADPWSGEAIEQEEMTQQCLRMLVDPDAKVAEARVFSSIDQVRKRLDAEERVWFCAQHERLYGLRARGLESTEE